MTPAQVEAIVGRPLSKNNNWGSGPNPTESEMWMYSSHRSDTANFWRRWVLFDKGKVVDVINDFWID
jgi:hypothetical protein